jgi:RNA 3'-phosphate cyclase
MTIDQYLDIDGSFGEGGGAIIRIGAGFSLLYKRPIRIKNIRANRPKPGLRMQHLMGLRALANLTNSELSHCEVGSKEIVLNPGHSVKNHIQVDISTAGNIGLLLQPIQIACLGLNSPDKIEIIINGGGTFGKWAPGLNYLETVTYKIFKNQGFRIDLDIQKHGFYPKGGAFVKCTIHPPKNNTKPLFLTELGNIDLIQGKIICTSHLKQKKVSERIKQSVQNQLSKELKLDAKIDYEYVNALSSGVGLYLWATSENGACISSGTILGERNITSEHLGKIATNELVKYIRKEIPVDNYLSDQLIPFMGFVKESSRIKVLELTNHTKTNLELMKLFLERKYKIIKEKDGYIIELQ